ncbi:MAG TPA: hypothetical protein VM533_13550, partial [Fimbriiglobus sp.]|nr:hypothetical protein [Fimbriiglobus sp.]
MLKRSLFTGSVLAAGMGILAAQAPPPPAAPATPAQPGQPAATTKSYRAKDLLGTRMNIEGNT